VKSFTFSEIYTQATVDCERLGAMAIVAVGCPTECDIFSCCCCPALRYSKHLGLVGFMGFLYFAVFSCKDLIFPRQIDDAELKYVIVGAFRSKY